MKRTAVLLYGVACYAAFLAVFVYAIGFVGNFGVPKALDSPSTTPFGIALATDLALLAVFALQHSVMARRPFKRFITRWIPVPAERSTYVLASSLALALLFWKWEPLGGVVWDVQPETGRALLYGGYGFGWALVLAATFAINHFDLFGLRQVWLEFTRRKQTPVAFAVPVLYRIVRHPLYVGWLFVFWSAPVMTVTHLFFAGAVSAYILVAIRFEEADLLREHPRYAAYRDSVPMLIPRFRRTVPAMGSAATTRAEAQP